jgi:hypothetical protein
MNVISQVDQSDFGFLADPILNIKRSDNPTESYSIPGDGITSESDGEIRSDYM